MVSVDHVGVRRTGIDCGLGSTGSGIEQRTRATTHADEQ